MRRELKVAAVIVTFSLAAPAMASQEVETLPLVHAVEAPPGRADLDAVSRESLANNGDIAVFSSQAVLPQPVYAVASADDAASSQTAVMFEPIDFSALTPAGGDAGQAGASDLVGEPADPQNSQKIPSTRDPLRPFNRVM